MSATSFKLPRDVQPGQPVLAETFNALLAFCRAVANARGGKGVLVRVRPGVGSGGELVIELVSGVIEERLPARIVECTVPDTAPEASSDVLYKVKASGRPDIPVTGWMKPDKGRPVKDSEGMEIWPRKVGDRCWLVRRIGEGPGGETVAELEVPTEKIAFGDCPPATVQEPVLPSLFDLAALPSGGA